jgi:hypothetical protein
MNAIQVNGALQAAEELIRTVVRVDVLKGHDFNRAANSLN